MVAKINFLSIFFLLLPRINCQKWDVYRLGLRKCDVDVEDIVRFCYNWGCGFGRNFWNIGIM